MYKKKTRYKKEGFIGSLFNKIFQSIKYIYNLLSLSVSLNISGYYYILRYYLTYYILSLNSFSLCMYPYSLSSFLLYHLTSCSPSVKKKNLAHSSNNNNNTFYISFHHHTHTHNTCYRVWSVSECNANFVRLFAIEIFFLSFPSIFFSVLHVCLVWSGVLKTKLKSVCVSIHLPFKKIRA